MPANTTTSGVKGTPRYNYGAHYNKWHTCVRGLWENMGKEIADALEYCKKEKYNVIVQVNTPDGNVCFEADPHLVSVDGKVLKVLRDEKTYWNIFSNFRPTAVALEINTWGKSKNYMTDKKYLIMQLTARKEHPIEKGLYPTVPIKGKGKR